MSEKAKQRWKDPEQYKYLKSCREKQMTEERRKRISETVKKNNSYKGLAQSTFGCNKRSFLKKEKGPKLV